jgi:hypothetical protein
LRKAVTKTQMFGRRATDSTSVASSSSMGIKKILGEMMSSKNYADVRVKLGDRKTGDHFGKSMKLNDIKWIEEVESVPSEIGKD